MLILTRVPNETIIINDNIKVTILNIKGNEVGVGIDAPQEVKVYRQEIYDRIQEKNQVYTIEIDLSIIDEVDISQQSLCSLGIPDWFVHEFWEDDFNQFISNWEKINEKKFNSTFYPKLKDYKIALMRLYAISLHQQGKDNLRIQELLKLTFGNSVNIEFKKPTQLQFELLC